jgi:large subunit ribosomal protein L19
MSNDLLKAAAAGSLKTDIPDFNVGDTVNVAVRIIEGDRERIQVFSGVVIARKGGGANETFTVRRIVSNEGVERVFPLHSPKISSIEVVRKGKARRAKLYYLRQRKGKSARVKDVRESSRGAASRARQGVETQEEIAADAGE